MLMLNTAFNQEITTQPKGRREREVSNRDMISDKQGAPEPREGQTKKEEGSEKERRSICVRTKTGGK